MRMIYNGTPIKSLNIKHYEMDTNDCTMTESDLQAGVTGVAKGRKITGTGRCFEFAQYGNMKTNSLSYIPSQINFIEITSLDYPIKSSIALTDMVDVDFSTEQTIGIVTIDNIEYPITVKIDGALLKLNCEKTISLDFFYGRDNYV